MMMLVRICGQHWHAVERDLLTLGYRKEDIGTPKLTLWELISVVVASPPGTAVFHAETRSGALTQESQFLANLSEQYAGIPLPGRYSRAGVDGAAFPTAPKVDSFSQLPDYGGFKFEAMDPGELVRKRAELAATMREKEASGELTNNDRVVVDAYSPFQKRSGNAQVSTLVPRIWNN